MSNEQERHSTDPLVTSHGEDRLDSPGIVDELLSRSIRVGRETQPAAPDQVAHGKRIEGIVIGQLVGVPSEGEKGGKGKVLVDYPNNPAGRPLVPLSTVAIRTSDTGRRVALAFEEGNPLKPVLIGFINHDYEHGQDRDRDRALGDGERLVLTAKQEIELRCGKSSITLTRAGKVLIRGAYLLNRSSGVNRIKGGSVQIN